MNLLEIRNFQGIHRLDIPLDGITVLVGPTDAGKSAALRALRWLLFNRPSGTSFIRRGAGKTRVRLHIDGHVIERIRSEKSNRYKLDGELLSSFSNTVPDQVKRILNISEISFQGQHDSPFWLASSPAQVSRELNSIVDLEIIDKALSRGAAGIRVARTNQTVAEERLASAKQERKKLRWVPGWIERARDAQRLENKIEDITRRCETLKDKIAQVERGRATAETLSQRTLKASGLLSIATRLHNESEVQKHLSSLIDRATRLSKIKPPPDIGIEPCLDLAKQIYRIQVLIASASVLIEERQDTLDKMIQIQDRLAKIPTCPSCKQPLP